MDLLVRMLNIRNFVQMYLGKHSNKIKTDWNQWQEYTYINIITTSKKFFIVKLEEIFSP